MTAVIKTAAPYGHDARIIDVECDSTQGLPSMQIVGLGNKAIDEARERVRASLRNCGFSPPARRLIINLAPADLPKDGSHYDLAIAVAVMTIGKILRPSDSHDYFFAGELTLDGQLRGVRGIVHIAEAALRFGARGLIVPKCNAAQAALIQGLPVYGMSSLQEVFVLLKKQRDVQAYTANDSDVLPPHRQPFAGIIGQAFAKRALVVAAAGRHNILFNGPPGTGKSLLAKSLIDLLPKPSQNEVISLTKLHSLFLDNNDVVNTRPFRSPHHSASHAAIIGGGSPPRPGEVSLAHRGVLFLDELPEYTRPSLEALRQPLEDRRIHLARVNGRVTYPADFMLVATQNPCPCGYLGDKEKPCICPPADIERYHRKLSGPLLDRIDMTVYVPRLPPQLLADHLYNSSDETVGLPGSHLPLHMIERARQAQFERYGDDTTNAAAETHDIARLMRPDRQALSFLRQASERMHLSVRAHFRTLKVARTIADIEGSPDILSGHVSEALQYRQRAP
ncbi:YifB family Mg chelatase-like AAA ATPase [Candidatus Saccharibacteria bacterium]|nr:YifB family Mg chelatase-like AAA ATPase [Candidatus Saccharibacteria bacterium]